MTDAELELNELFAPLTMDQFRRDHLFAGKHYVRRGSLDAFRKIAEFPELAHPAAFCASFRHGTSVLGPGGFTGHLSVASEAFQFYNAGYMIYATGVERSIPRFVPVLAEVAYLFGCRPGGVTTEVFFSRPGAGATMHYDFDVNFQILLRGRKRWKLAENTSIANPLTSYFVLNEATHRRGVDRLYADKRSFPREMPATATEIDAGPGTVIFLPRGMWHETTTTEESLGVNFVLKARPWASAASSLLYHSLIQHAEWRAFSIGTLGNEDDLEDPEHDPLTVARALIDGFKRLAATVTPEALFAEATSSGIYSWPENSERTIVRTDDGASLVVKLAEGGPTPVEIELDEDAVEFVEKLAARQLPFRMHQIVHDFTTRSCAYVPHLIEQLVDAQALLREGQD